MAKQVYLLLPFSLLTLTFTACTLEKEPEIPTGVTNRVDPHFASTMLEAISHDSIRTEARLSPLGNLNILHYGWVWSEDSLPTLEEDSALVLDSLGINSVFKLTIPGLTVGKTYHLRPFVATGRDTFYGPDSTKLMGIPKVNDIIVLDTSACRVRIRCSIETPLQYSEFGVVYRIGQGLPTYDQNDGWEKGTTISNDTFEIDLTMLNPSTLYSFRAYAISKYGKGYSKVLTIITPISTLGAANFTINTDAEIFDEAIVMFNNQTIGATSYLWDFGDGTTSTEASPVHTFTQPAALTVRLTAENGGCRLTKDMALNVTSNPFENYWSLVEGGSFMMGCDGMVQDTCFSWELPIHEVTISAFEIGNTEVTQGQWLAVTGFINPSIFNQCGLDCPVENVSWDQIVNIFIPALYRKTGRDHRLPTEAEWEYAARGEENTKYAGSNNLDDIGWYDDNSMMMTQKVMGKDDNKYGLFDMSGNVSEWVQDNWHGDYNGAPSDGSAWVDDPPGFTRVIRGGSWGGDAAACRIAARMTFNLFTKSDKIGFRLVRSQ